MVNNHNTLSKATVAAAILLSKAMTKATINSSILLNRATHNTHPKIKATDPLVARTHSAHLNKVAFNTVKPAANSVPITLLTHRASQATTANSNPRVETMPTLKTRLTRLKWLQVANKGLLASNIPT